MLGVSISAAVLTALQTFVDFGGRSDKHRIAGVKYKATIRSLEYMLVRLSNQETISDDEITSLRTQLDNLEESAPVVMPRIYDVIEKRYLDVAYVNNALELYRSAVGEAKH